MSIVVRKRFLFFMSQNSWKSMSMRGIRLLALFGQDNAFRDFLRFRSSIKMYQYDKLATKCCMHRKTSSCLSAAINSVSNNHYSTEDKKTFAKQGNVSKKEFLEEMYQEKKEKLARSREMFLKDIRETKEKVREKMEEAIEKENVATIPNLLCVLRIAVAPYLGYLVLQSEFHLAVALFAFAGFTDLIDGWIARTYPSQSSKFGSFLDPMADKVLIACLFLTLTYAGFIPIVLTGMIIVRDLLLVGAGFYIRYKSLPPPRTLSRYFDATYATAQLAPTYISKINTTIQLVLACATLGAPVFGYVDHSLLHGLWYLTGGTTIASAVSYLTSHNTYKYFRPRK